MAGGSEFHILGAAPEKARLYDLFFLKRAGWSNKSLADREFLVPPEITSFRERNAGDLE